MNLDRKAKKRAWLDISYIAVLIAAATTIFVVQLVYISTQNLLKERLRERLTAIASTAALQFEVDMLDEIQDRNDIAKPELRQVTELMNRIRASNQNLEFIYLLRPTEDPHTQIFIADADTLAALEDLDENENGILDDEENPPQPGDEYDSNDLPAFQEALKGNAIADYELNSDQWGTFLSGYAPIKNQDGEVIAILGIDVEVSDFNTLVRATLIPFILLSSFLLFTLIVLTLILTHIWKNRVEIVKELDQQKDELLGIVSHQLATPVSSIKWYTEMLIDGDMGKITKEQKEHISTMQSIALNLSDLVSMILDVSRIQLGRMKIEKQKMDLHEFFNEIISVIEPKSAEKKVDFIKKIPSELPEAFLDKRYTRMTIENLLTNAIKYTPAGGSATIEVKLSKNKLSCTVSDTGMGIPKEDQGKIFGKLYRASNVRNSIDGNGFGLYVAKGAIEAQGGKIWFESIENKGTTFYVELPLEGSLLKK